MECERSHLAICDGVVVDPHLRVNVLQVPAKALTLKSVPQGYSLRNISEIHSGILKESKYLYTAYKPCHHMCYYNRLVSVTSDIFPPLLLH